jgi:hypothetical protein
MMPETAGGEPAGQEGCAAMRYQMAAFLAEFGAIITAIERDPDRPDNGRRMNLLTSELRRACAKMDGHVLGEPLIAAVEAQAYQRGRADERAAGARVPGQRARHASQRSWMPRLVQGIIPAGSLGAALRGSLRHSWVAHHAVAATMAGAGTVAVLTAAVTLAPPSVTHVFSGGTAGAPNPAASIESAVPIPSPSSPLRLVAGVTHPRPRLDADSSGAVTPVPWYAYNPPAASGAPSQQPPAAAPPAGPAVLEVSAPAAGLSLTTSLTSATVTLSATGSGWVAWHVDAGGPDLDFSADHGVLAAGQSYQLVVTVDPAQATDGNTAQTFSVNGTQVTAALPPQVAVVPSPADTSVPSPAAS